MAMARVHDEMMQQRSTRRLLIIVIIIIHYEAVRHRLRQARVYSTLDGGHSCSVLPQNGSLPIPGPASPPSKQRTIAQSQTIR